MSLGTSNSIHEAIQKAREHHEILSNLNEMSKEDIDEEIVTEVRHLHRGIKRRYPTRKHPVGNKQRRRIADREQKKYQIKQAIMFAVRTHNKTLLKRAHEELHRIGLSLRDIGLSRKSS